MKSKSIKWASISAYSQAANWTERQIPYMILTGKFSHIPLVFLFRVRATSDAHGSLAFVWSSEDDTQGVSSSGIRETRLPSLVTRAMHLEDRGDINSRLGVKSLRLRTRLVSRCRQMIPLRRRSYSTVISWVRLWWNVVQKALKLVGGSNLLGQISLAMCIIPNIRRLL